LLDSFTRHIARNGRILVLAPDLVDFVDVNNATFGGRDVKLGLADELEDQVFDVLADVAGLGQRGGVADGERDVQAAREGLRQGGLASAGRADEEDVALGDDHVLQGGVFDRLVLGGGH